MKRTVPLLAVTNGEVGSANTLRRVVVATADVQPYAIDTATGNECPRVGTLAVTPPNGFVSHTLKANLPICNATISSVD